MLPIAYHTDLIKSDITDGTNGTLAHGGKTVLILASTDIFITISLLAIGILGHFSLITMPCALSTTLLTIGGLIPFVWGIAPFMMLDAKKKTHFGILRIACNACGHNA